MAKKEFKELLHCLRLSDEGDTEAFDKACEIGHAIWLNDKTYTAKQRRQVRVTHPDGTSYVYNSLEETKRECKIGPYEFGQLLGCDKADKQGRRYEYVNDTEEETQ